MLPTTLPAISHYFGDLWRDGYRHFGPMTLENGNPPAPPCLFCQMVFTDDKTGALLYEINSDPGTGQGTLTIVNGTTYEFDIPNQALPLARGSHKWALKTYLTAEHTDPPITWFDGSIQVK